MTAATESRALDVLADPSVFEAVDALVTAEQRLHTIISSPPDYQALTGPFRGGGYEAASNNWRQSKFAAEGNRAKALERAVKVLERRVAEVAQESGS
jgi:hypothetical protein